MKVRLVGTLLGMGDDLGDWVAYLDGEIALAAATMTVELGDESVCTVHRDGRVTGGLKYQEGRLTAFAEIRRIDVEPDHELAALDELRRKWSAELDLRRAADRPSMPWVSYATGGLEAVETAMDRYRQGIRSGQEGDPS